MIHVNEQPEPANFNANVRLKGLKYLSDHGIDPNTPLPPKTIISTCWRDCLDDMYTLYSGTCAYLAVHFERVTGAGSVDHFIAKSPMPSRAYDWPNYRLACSKMNSCKREYDDVLDPFLLADGWFHVELVSGRIFANPERTAAEITLIDAAIERLGLDEPGCREMRGRHYLELLSGRIHGSFSQQAIPVCLDGSQPARTAMN